MSIANLRRYTFRTLSDFWFWARYGYWPRHYRGLDEVSVSFTGITLPIIERTEVCPRCLGLATCHPCAVCNSTGVVKTSVKLPPLNLNEIATVQSLSRRDGGVFYLDLKGNK